MKKRTEWYLLCTISFIISTFLHECMHGLQSFLTGHSVSTGFNRVGNIYKYPKDFDFRLNFNNGNYFLDAGVILTLLLAVIFMILYCNIKTDHKSKILLAFAYCNSLMRLVPSLLSLILPLFGIVHIEDEIDTGAEWVTISGIPFLRYLPAVICVIVSIVCLIFIYKEYRKKGSIASWLSDSSLLLLAFITSFYIENQLDRFIRINWAA